MSSAQFYYHHYTLFVVDLVSAASAQHMPLFSCMSSHPSSDPVIVTQLGRYVFLLVTPTTCPCVRLSLGLFVHQARLQHTCPLALQVQCQNNHFALLCAVLQVIRRTRRTFHSCIFLRRIIVGCGASIRLRAAGGGVVVVAGAAAAAVVSEEYVSCLEWRQAQLMSSSVD